MAMTITEKIFAKASGKRNVQPGENVWLNVDILMTHDVCGPPTIEIWKKEFGKKARIWDKDKLVVMPDHFIFMENVSAKRNIEVLRSFAAEHELPHYYDPGSERYRGVCHIALAEEGFNLPGTVLFGTDSHTCTSSAFGMFATGIGNTDAAFILGTGKIWEKVPASIKFSLHGLMPPYLMAKDVILHILGDIRTDGATYCMAEFDGDAIHELPMDERMTLTNMAIEMGAMSGIIAADEQTVNYLQNRTKRSYEILYSDAGAAYYRTLNYKIDEMVPAVAQPHSPDRRELVRTLSGRKVTECYIGSCTGGKITDFRAAAKILHGKQAVVPTFIVPATCNINDFLSVGQYVEITLRNIFENSGCTIVQPSCAACLGGTEDTIGRACDNDVVISTTNRNFPGRMGSKHSEVYLASALTV